jgi:hypothetical protein
MLKPDHDSGGGQEGCRRRGVSRRGEPSTLEVHTVNLVNDSGAGEAVAVDSEDNAVLKGDDLLASELEAVHQNTGVKAATPQVFQ